MTTATQPPFESDSPRSRLFGVELIILLTLVVYLPAIQGGFLWDDGLLVTNNTCVRLADGWWRAWLTPSPPDYFPLTINSFWLEWQLWGESPHGYHVTNVLLHVLNAVLVLILLRQLRIRWAWAAALLFALHPVAVPSVAWISERKNVLSMLFYLLSISAFLRFDEGGRWRWYAAAVLGFALALCSKTSVVMLPVVLLICLVWRRRTVARRDVLRTVPFFALALIMGLVTIWFQQQHAIHGQMVRPEGLASRVAAAGWVLGFYLWKDILPLNLTMVYPRWSVPAWNPLAYLPLLACAGGLAWCYRRRATWGWPVGLALAYVGAVLLPVLGLVDMSYTKYSLVADHLQYLALPGLAALAAGGAAWLTDSWSAERRTVLQPLAVLLFAVLGALSMHRSYLFADGERLWADNIAKAPDCWAAYRNLGASLCDRGDYEGAAEAARRSIALYPGDAQAYHVLGVAESLAGRAEESVAAFRKALATDPGIKGVQYNLGISLFNIQRYGEAQTAFRAAAAESPRHAGVQYWLGNCAFALGDRAAAEAHLRTAISLEPAHPAAYVRLAEILVTDPAARSQNKTEALVLAAQALALGADRSWSQLDRLAIVHAALGLLNEAAQLEQQALAAPDVPEPKRREMMARLEQYRRTPAAPTVEGTP